MFPLIAVQIATLGSRRIHFAILALVMVMLLSAMEFGGWMSEARTCWHCGWMGLLVSQYGIGAILLSGNEARYAFFQGRRQGRAWCWSQGIVHVLVSLGFIAAFLAFVALRFGTCEWRILPGMVLFSFVFAQAIFTGLQPAFRTISATKRLSLLLVSSIPWVLTAWILGLYAGDAWIAGEVFPLVALGGLGLAQTIVSLAATENR